MRTKYICLMISIFTFVSVNIHAGKAPFKYEARGRRDPFIPLISTDRSSQISLKDVVSVDELKLEGIATTGSGGKRFAIMNGEMLKENEKIGNVKIKQISNAEVLLTISEKEYIISLPKKEEGLKSGKE